LNPAEGEMSSGSVIKWEQDTNNYAIPDADAWSISPGDLGVTFWRFSALPQLWAASKFQDHPAG